MNSGKFAGVVVLGIITISGLWLFVTGQERSQSNAVLVSEPSIQTHEATKAIGTEVAWLSAQMPAAVKSMLRTANQFKGTRSAR